MKKTISIFLLISTIFSMVLIQSSARESYGVAQYIQAMNIERSISLNSYLMYDKITPYLEENIDNYFLPAAYDTSPLSAVEYSGISSKYIYENLVVYDDKGKISVPPMYTGVVTAEFTVGLYSDSVFATYLVYEAANKNNMVMTDTMWRALNTKSPYTAINAFIAPWTLYNDGELYTWPELMAMSEDELNALNFESYNFYTFISGVKEALETREWWKEEYQDKYDLLAAHRNDYPDAQPENETLTVDGKKVFLARMNEEYSSSEKKNLNNIISVNIYNAEFKKAFDGLDENVKEKYSEFVGAVEAQLDYNYYQASMQSGNEYYREPSQTEFAPNAIACEKNLRDIWYLLDVDDSQVKYQHAMLFAVIDECNVSKDKIKEACDRYNYIAGVTGALDEKTIDVIVNGTKQEQVDYFKYDTSIVLSYDPIVVFPWWEIRVDYNVHGEIIVEPELKLCDDSQRFINDVEELYNNSPEKDKAHIGEYIEFIKDYYAPPATGDTSTLYLVIAAAALVTMSAMVVKKRRIGA